MFCENALCALSADVLLEELYSQGDVRGGVVAHLTLDGQEALKADVIQCLEVVGEIHGPLAQGKLDEGGIPQHIDLHHAVEDFRVHIVEAAAILGVGVDDIVL